MKKRSEDFLLQTIINVFLLCNPSSFWDVKRHLKKIGFELDKATLLKRIKQIL